MKYGSQPTREETGVCPLLEIKRGFAVLEYSRCCLPLDTTQTHKCVSDTAIESHRRLLFLLDLAAGQGWGTRLGETPGCKEKRPNAAMQTGAGASLHHHCTRYCIFKPKDTGEKKRKQKRASKSFPTCLIFHRQLFSKGWEGKYPPEDVSIISPKGFLTRKQVLKTKNLHGSPQKPFRCGSLLFPAVYQLIRHTLL